MRIYTRSGDLAFKLFTFPDGQPHFILETYEREFNSVTIETAIRSPQALMEVLLVNDVLRQHGYGEVQLDVRYLMGARMDRAISPFQPYTLQVIARVLNSCGFSRVRLLDVHSDVATRLIRNSVNLLPWSVVQQVIHTSKPSSLVCPDAGAVPRLMKFYNVIGLMSTVRCVKKRDMTTGALSGFSAVYNPPNVHGTELLIVDDICDGGGTFTGLAKVLREAGAKKVSLFVTHGIFSKGLPLEGIDQVYTTNSFHDAHTDITNPNFRPFERVAPYSSALDKVATVIPISMKEMI